MYYIVKVADQFCVINRVNKKTVAKFQTYDEAIKYVTNKP